MTHTTVEAIHIERELIRIDFPHSCLVSDHPPVWGGGDKGPTAGDMMLAALASASVFCAMDAARRHGARLNTVVARTGYQAVREGVSGPLHALGYMGRFWRRLEIDGALNGADPRQLAADVGILQSIRNGLDLEERVDFLDTPKRGAPATWKNTVFSNWEGAVKGLNPGEKMMGPQESSWRISATSLDYDTVLVDVPGAPICVSRTSSPRRGPTPHELLLGSLAACTSVYIARNAPYNDIPLDRIAVVVRAETPSNLSQAIKSMEKVTTLTGHLTDAEKEKCKFIAEHCALGETLKRGAEMMDDVIANGATVATSAQSPFANLRRASPPPSELACDDGACCVYIPAMTAESASESRRVS